MHNININEQYSEYIAPTPFCAVNKKISNPEDLTNLFQKKNMHFFCLIY